MANSIQQYDNFRNNNKFVFVVFYRGSWCPFCQAYLKQLQLLSPKIKAAGGQVVTVTAEAASELPKMRQLTGYDGETIVDPENQLVAELKRRNLIEVAISEKNGYPHGMAQPAVLVGGNDVGILFKWAIEPSTMNLGGAKDRPDLVQVWENAEAQMQGQSPVHAKIGLMNFWTGLRQMLFG